MKVKKEYKTSGVKIIEISNYLRVLGKHAQNEQKKQDSKI